MSILNFGSLNIDYVYEVDHFTRKGETQSSKQLNIYPGGKGLNQSVALARAGGTVFHGGKIGPEGAILLEALKQDGVNVDYVEQSETPTGHAIIQVDTSGDNGILLFPGANNEISAEQIQLTLSRFAAKDILLLQNEVNGLEALINQSKAKGMMIVFNPAPFHKSILALPLNNIDTLILNEIEGQEMTGESDENAIVEQIIGAYPHMEVILTLGKEGIYYKSLTESYRLMPSKVFKPVDTTAAGDTFIGYFIAGKAAGLTTEKALRQARSASEICIMTPGASVSIPQKVNVIRTMEIAIQSTN